MRVQEVVQAIKEHNWEVVKHVSEAPPELVDSLEHALSEFDGESRELAVACLVRHNGPKAGDLLLKLTDEENPDVSGAAASGLAEISHPPPVDEILAALPKREDPFVRGHLYLAAGRSKDKSRLEALRRLAKDEKDSAAAFEAQAAAVKLGGAEEREAFLNRVREAEPDDVAELAEQLLYVGDPKLAKGMIPWLSKEDGVSQLGSDRNPKMARMCDYAVWMSHRLGVKFQIKPDHLTNFDAQVVARALSALREL